MMRRHIIIASLVLFTTSCTLHADSGGGYGPKVDLHRNGGTTMTPEKDRADFDEMMKKLVPQAKNLLEKFGGFYPFGGF